MALHGVYGRWNNHLTLRRGGQEVEQERQISKRESSSHTCDPVYKTMFLSMFPILDCCGNRRW